MIFNFARKRTGKTAGEGKTPAADKPLAPSPEAEGCGTHCIQGRTTDAAGAPVAFGPVYTALSDIEVGGRGVLGEFDMPEHMAEQLMNLGFVPGLEVTVAQSGPGGDPRVYRVDGAEVALRGDLAKLIAVAPALEAERERVVSVRGESAAPAVYRDDRMPGGRPGTTQAEVPTPVGLGTQEASAD